MSTCLVIKSMIAKRIGNLCATGVLLTMCACGALQIPHLISLSIIPNVTAIPLGKSVQFKSIGLYSDGSSDDITAKTQWTCVTPEVARIDASGMATSIAAGRATVQAKSVEGLSAAASLTVGNAALVSIAVSSSPSSVDLGDTAQLVVTGTFTDNSSQNLIANVTWSSANQGVAEVSASGVVTPKSVGATVITATTSGLQASAPVQVLAAPLVAILVSSDRSSIPLATSAKFMATGVYKDGSTQDLTGAVAWAASPATVVSINAAGVATGKSIGTAVVTAGAGSISVGAGLTVAAAALVSIDIASSQTDMPLGTTQQLVATGTYTDGTTQDLSNSATWGTSSSDVLGVSAKGVAVARLQGAATVSASLDTIQGTASMSVSGPVLQSVSISPSNPKVPLGSMTQISAMGHFSDGTIQRLTQNLTWSAADSLIAGVSVHGVAVGRKVGSTGIEVSTAGMVADATLSVHPLELVNYFANDKIGGDSTVRLTNPGLTGGNLCAMIYVFDEDQQMAECCGCSISPDALRTLSLNKDLISNTLTGKTPSSGSVVVVSADYLSNKNCDASSITPQGTTVAWSTHLQSSQSGPSAVTETPFSTMPLGDDEANGLQSQCNFIHQLGSKQGICGCGTGK
jgi:Bacterial Ig-like domain (group 2)